MTVAALESWAREQGIYIGRRLNPGNPDDYAEIRRLREERRALCRLYGVPEDEPADVPPLDAQIPLPGLLV